MARLRLKRFGRYELQVVEAATIGDAIRATRAVLEFPPGLPLMLLRNHHLFRDPDERADAALEKLANERRVAADMETPFFEVLPRLVNVEAVYRGRRTLVALAAERPLREVVDMALREIGDDRARATPLAIVHDGRVVVDLSRPVADTVGFGPDNYPVTFVLELVEATG